MLSIPKLGELPSALGGMAVVGDFSGLHLDSRETSSVMGRPEGFLRLENLDQDFSFKNLICSRNNSICRSHVSIRSDTSILEQSVLSTESSWYIQSRLKPGNEVPKYGYMLCWDREFVKPKTISLLSNSWHYRGEGNANLVVAFDNERSIIRFLKHDNGSSWTDREKKKLERQVVFRRNIFAPLLGKNLVASVCIVHVSPDDIARLNTSLRMIRPSARLHKEIVMPYATRQCDFARIEMSRTAEECCIELKPKKGWWSVGAVTIPNRPNRCKHCLHQYLKIKKGRIAARSAYCPLDLFSGDAQRMVRAVIALLKNPQNNFRMFKRGSQVFQDNNIPDLSQNLFSVLREWISKTEATDAFTNIGLVCNVIYLVLCSLLYPQNDPTGPNLQRYLQLTMEIEMVLRALMSDSDFDVLQPSNQEPCSPESKELPQGCVLSMILQIQKLEDATHEEISRIFQKVCPLHSNSLSKTTCPAYECCSTQVWLDEVNTERLTPKELACIQRHLLAATLKDCSVMITFIPVQKSSPPAPTRPPNLLSVQDLYFGQHLYRVGIVDLDPKPLQSVVKHNLREFEMVRAYHQLN